MASQWERLLKNTGTWVGSFTQFSLTGEPISDTPTEVALLPQEGGQMMRQEIRRKPVGGTPQTTVLEYRSLGKGVVFCEDGAFSQGSIQWSPFGDFGAELGLIQGQERLRLVQLFKGQRTLSSLTLIRECLEGTQPQVRPPVTIDQLLGTWEGEASSAYPDWQPDTRAKTRLEIEQIGSDEIRQTLQVDEAPLMQSVGRVRGNTVQFDQGSQPVTVLMLPDGASAMFPTQIEGGKPLFLEVGWLIRPDLRQRLIRTYNSQGTWISLTLVTERKVG